MPLVELTREELDEAVKVGKARFNVHDSIGRFDNKVIASGVDADIQGAIGEKVVSKFLNLPWDGKFKNNEDWLVWRRVGHDVSGFEVRFTKHKAGRLILHNKDKNNSIFILVVEMGNCLYDVVGWCKGIDGKKKDYWKDVGYGRPCYYVPRNQMKSMEQLP